MRRPVSRISTLLLRRDEGQGAIKGIKNGGEGRYRRGEGEGDSDTVPPLDY